MSGIFSGARRRRSWNKIPRNPRRSTLARTKINLSHDKGEEAIPICYIEVESTVPLSFYKKIPQIESALGLELSFHISLPCCTLLIDLAVPDRIKSTFVNNYLPKVHSPWLCTSPRRRHPRPPRHSSSSSWLPGRNSSCIHPIPTTCYLSKWMRHVQLFFK